VKNQKGMTRIMQPKNINKDTIVSSPSRERGGLLARLSFKSILRIEEKYDAYAMGLVVPGAYCCHCHCNTSCA